VVALVFVLGLVMKDLTPTNSFPGDRSFQAVAHFWVDIAIDQLCLFSQKTLFPKILSKAPTSILEI